MARTAQVINLNQVNRDRSYRFKGKDRDPDLEFICNAITRSGMGAFALSYERRWTKV